MLVPVWLPLINAFFSLSHQSAIPRNDEVTDTFVDLGYLKAQGYVNATSGLRIWKALPYAWPPTGDQRYRPPQAPAYEQEVRNATAPGPTCLNGIRGGNPATFSAVLNEPKQSEDCLTLDIYSPPGAENLAVYVYIHGGGYLTGGSSSVDPTNIVQLSNNSIVAVALQYRLGALGFLGGKELLDEGATNLGLLDQAFALQWVQDNIARFGGDQSRVTIHGESAGAGSVMHQSLAYGGRTQSLFRGAAMHSNYIPPIFKCDASQVEDIFDEFTRIAGCSTADNKLACLRSVDSNILRRSNAQMSLFRLPGDFTFYPCIDGPGKFIEGPPSQALLDGKVSAKAALVSNNLNEAEIFLPPASAFPDDTTETFHHFVSVYYPQLAEDRLAEIDELYPEDAYESARARLSALWADTTFVCPSYWFAQAFTVSADKKAFKQLYAVPPSRHADDLQWYTRTGPTTYTSPDFVQDFTGAISSLVLSLDPNTLRGPSTPVWTQFTGLSNSTELQFNVSVSAAPGVAGSAGPTAEPDVTVQSATAQLSICDRWRKLAASVPQ